MPQQIISLFISIAFLFFLYSTLVYFIHPIKWRSYLKIIAILNSGYCLFTLYHVFLSYEHLTVYGLLYFLGEVLVILLLSSYELHQATSSTDS
jgi:hypothetical protein